MTAESEIANQDDDVCIDSRPRSLKELLQRSQSFRSTASGSSASNGITYSHQSQLPRLPIPSLEETLYKLPTVLQALQDDKQQEETARVVQEFLEGDGPKLQEALIEYERAGVDTGQIGSYVEEFWNESYLAPNESVVLNLNPFFVLEDGPDPKIAKDPIKRAASLCFASIKIASVLKHETLSPDVFKGKPLCMDQFKALFGSSRQPAVHNTNTSSTNTNTSSNNNNHNNSNSNSNNSNHNNGKICDEVHVYSDSSHVVVLCKNQFYYFPALWPHTGTVAVDEADLADILRAIQKHASTVPQEEASRTALGVFSSLPRSEWAMARQELCRNKLNASALHIIDSALFVLVLDDFDPPDIHAAAANMLHGTNQLAEGDFFQCGSCLNRWYDKLQLIVCSDGTCGVNFEHSAVDGHTALRFVSDIFAETVISFAESIVDVIHGRGRIQHVVDAVVERAGNTIGIDGSPKLDVFPKKLVFDLPESVIDRIYYAETALCDDVSASDTFVLEFRDYGKQLICANNLSPDSFVQMSIMLAYYKLYGKIVCAYEPVLTKLFYHGRTEAMRTATPQAKELCQIWCNKASTPKDRLHALRVATLEHSRLVKESSLGMGVDRHLYSLKCLAERKGMPVPAFFQSEAWKTLNHTVLSTSNCGNPALRLFGFGPVVPDGFGIGYVIKDYGISYSVSSKHRQTQRYVRSLENTLKEMQELLDPTTHVRVKHRSLRELQHDEHPLLHNEYDDVYGESSVTVADSVAPLPPGHKREGSKGFHRIRRKKGSFFKQVVEKQHSFDFLSIPQIQIDLDLNGDDFYSDICSETGN